MATPPTGTLTGDLGDILNGTPQGAGLLHVTPTMGWVAYASTGYMAAPVERSLTVAADGTINASLPRTDLGNPANFTYKCWAEVPGLSTHPFEIVITKASQTIAEALVTKRPGQAPWQQIIVVPGTGQVQTIIPNATDWDTLTVAGFMSAPSSGRSYTNTPYPDFVGSVVVYDAQNSTGFLQTQMAISYNPATIWLRERNTAGVWQPWREVAVDMPDRMQTAPARRSVLVDAAVSRRGGVIGTRGRAAVALRFDHHLVPFRDKVLPLLRQYKLPWGQFINPANVGSGDDAVGWPTIAEWCYTSGGEVWNHSWSHVDVTTTVAADREVTSSLSSLKANLPDLYIDGWGPPGQTTYLGYEGQDTPEKHWNTYPGKLALAQHALVRGYYPGVYQPLSGPNNLVGYPHTTMDTMTATTAGQMLTGAISAGAGVTYLLHSNYLDTAGYMTTADLSTFLANIANRRDNGEIVVLTPSAIMLADSDQPASRNLLSSASALSPGTVTTSWTETVTVRMATSQYGVPHEATAWVKATVAGDVSLSVAVTDGGGTVRTQTHTRTMTAGQSARLGVVTTPPLSTTSTVVTLTGSVQHTGIRYHAV